jgi:peptidoglycan hydrolase CwlO-like protein
MTDHQPDHVATRSSQHRLVPWLIVVLVIILAGGAIFWTNHNAVTKSEAPLQKADVSPPQDPAVEQIKQTLSALQQTVQDIQSGQQKLVEQINDIQRKSSADQGERKMLSEQLGALSARVDTLVSTNAESTPAAPESTPAAAQTQKNKRSKR